VKTLLRWLFHWGRNPVTNVIIGLVWAALGISALEGKHDSIDGWLWLGGGIVLLAVGVATRIIRGEWKPRLLPEDDWRNGTGLYR
jgi:hypothetical protein